MDLQLFMPSSLLVAPAVTLVIAGCIFFLITSHIMASSSSSPSVSPFKVMQAVYVYIAALIGLGLVAAGLYNLLESLLMLLLAESVFVTAMLVTPFTQIVVGLFVMVPHWAIGHHFHMTKGK